MIYQRALFTFVAVGVATVGGFTSKAAQGRGVISTTTTAILETGSTSIPVTNDNGFKVGDYVEIKSSRGKEKSKVIGFGSITISPDCPITMEHPPGATVTVVTAGDFTCEAELCTTGSSGMACATCVGKYTSEACASCNQGFALIGTRCAVDADWHTVSESEFVVADLMGLLKKNRGVGTSPPNIICRPAPVSLFFHTLFALSCGSC